MNYYIEKLNSLLWICTNSSIYGNSIYTNSSRSITNYNHVVFFFNYPRQMHLGDQMYFKPLIKKLKNYNVNVSVSPTDNMSFFFGNNTSNEISRDALFVSRVEVLPYLFSTFGNPINYFMYNTMSLNIDIPISNYILNTFCDFYDLRNVNLAIDKSDYLDFPLNKEDKYNLGERRNIVIFNNYVDSGKFRVMGGKRKLLRALEKEKEGSFIIHLGSEKDKMNDRISYGDFVDLDLRGMTSPMDVFSILSLESIKNVFCHDTFILHVANLYHRPIKLMFKKFYRPGEHDQKRNAFTSLFIKDTSHIELL